MGRGVKVSRNFKRGEFVVEYAGRLLTRTEARAMEEVYKKEGKGCFMMYFSFRDKSFW